MHKYELRAWLSTVIANICLSGGQNIAGYIWSGLAAFWLIALIMHIKND